MHKRAGCVLHMVPRLYARLMVRFIVNFKVLYCLCLFVCLHLILVLCIQNVVMCLFLFGIVFVGVGKHDTACQIWVPRWHFKVWGIHFC